MTKMFINGQERTTNADPRTPLLWVLRDHLEMTGTKYGCGIGQCGACTVILDGDAVRSCQVLLSRAAGKRITTIEGLSPDRSHPVQRAWLQEQVPQCGYCQSGQIMAATVLLTSNNKPTDGEIDDALSGNICRCGTYHRIRKAVHFAAELMREGK